MRASRLSSLTCALLLNEEHQLLRTAHNGKLLSALSYIARTFHYVCVCVRGLFQLNVSQHFNSKLKYFLQLNNSSLVNNTPSRSYYRSSPSDTCESLLNYTALCALFELSSSIATAYVWRKRRLRGACGGWVSQWRLIVLEMIVSP